MARACLRYGVDARMASCRANEGGRRRRSREKKSGEEVGRERCERLGKNGEFAENRAVYARLLTQNVHMKLHIWRIWAELSVMAARRGEKYTTRMVTVKAALKYTSRSDYTFLLNFCKVNPKCARKSNPRVNLAEGVTLACAGGPLRRRGLPWARTYTLQARQERGLVGA